MVLSRLDLVKYGIQRFTKKGNYGGKRWNKRDTTLWKTLWRMWITPCRRNYRTVLCEADKRCYLGENTEIKRRIAEKRIFFCVIFFVDIWPALCFPPELWQQPGGFDAGKLAIIQMVLCVEGRKEQNAAAVCGERPLCADGRLWWQA